MSNRIIIQVGLVLVVGLAYCTQARAQEKELAKELAKIDYTVLYPVRDGFVPGRVYREIRDTQGRKQIEVLCQNIFSDTPDAVVSANWILAKRNYKTNFSLGAVLALLKGALVERPDASADVKASFDWNRAITVSFQGVLHNSVPVERRFKKGPKGVTLAPECLNAMEDHKKRDPKLKNLYLVAETLTARELSVTVDRKAAANLEVSARLSDLVSVAPKIGFSFDNEGNLASGAVENPVTFGYYSVRFSEYRLATGGAAGGEGNAIIGLDFDFDGALPDEDL